MWMNLSPNQNFCKAENTKSQSNLSNVFIQFIWHIEYVSQVVKRVCKIIGFFLIAGDRFSSIILSKVFAVWFLRIAVYESIVCNIFFITFFIYGRYDFCSRSNIHGAKLSRGVINNLKGQELVHLKCVYKILL